MRTFKNVLYLSGDFGKTWTKQNDKMANSSQTISGYSGVMSNYEEGFATADNMTVSPVCLAIYDLCD